MANIITAGNSTNGGTAITTDTSGTLNIVTGSGSGATAISVDASQATTFAAGVSGTTGSFSGNMSFNSGYGSSAVAYGCRAWVNFNGTGTVAIRASGNVTSITDNGTGDYTVNFTTAMPDVNYASSLYFADASGFYAFGVGSNFSKTTTTYRIGNLAKNSSATIWNAAAGDFPNVDVAIFR